MKFVLPVLALVMLASGAVLAWQSIQIIIPHGIGDPELVQLKFAVKHGALNDAPQQLDALFSRIEKNESDLARVSNRVMTCALIHFATGIALLLFRWWSGAKEEPIQASETTRGR